MYARPTMLLAIRRKGDAQLAGRRLGIARLAIVGLLCLVACSDAANSSGAPPAGSSTPPASSPPSATPSASSSAATITHAPGTVPTAAPKTAAALDKLPPVAPRFERTAPRPASRVGQKELTEASWFDATHFTLASPGRLEIVELPTGSSTILTTGARIISTARNATHLITSDDSDRLVLWDLKFKTQPQHWQSSATAVAAADLWPPLVAISPDGTRIAWGGKPIKVWNERAEEIANLSVDYYLAQLVVTNSELITTSNNTTIQALRIDDGKEAAAAGFDTGATFPALVSPDGRWAAGSAPAGHGMAVSEVHRKGSVRQIVEIDDCHHHVSPTFSNDSRRVFAWLGGGWVKAFETGSWTPYASYRTSPDRSIASISDDLGRVLTTKEATDPRVVVVSTTKETPLETPFTTAVRYSLSEDGLMVLGMDENKEVRVWSTKTARVIYTITPG